MKNSHYHQKLLYIINLLIHSTDTNDKYKVPVPHYGDPAGKDYLKDVWRSVIVKKYEFPGYDGWYNNRAHPDWGAAGKLKTHNQVYPFSGSVREQLGINAQK